MTHRMQRFANPFATVALHVPVSDTKHSCTNMDPIVSLIMFTCNCRGCLEDFQLSVNPDTLASGLEVELLAHETMDDNGWADDHCPKCVGKLAQPEPYQEWKDAQDNEPT